MAKYSCCSDNIFLYPQPIHNVCGLRSTIPCPAMINLDFNTYPVNFATCMWWWSRAHKTKQNNDNKLQLPTPGIINASNLFGLDPPIIMKACGITVVLHLKHFTARASKLQFYHPKPEWGQLCLIYIKQMLIWMSHWLEFTTHFSQPGRFIPHLSQHMSQANKLDTWHTTQSTNNIPPLLVMGVNSVLGSGPNHHTPLPLLSHAIVILTGDTITYAGWVRSERILQRHTMKVTNALYPYWTHIIQSQWYSNKNDFGIAPNHWHRWPQ